MADNETASLYGDKALYDSTAQTSAKDPAYGSTNTPDDNSEHERDETSRSKPRVAAQEIPYAIEPHDEALSDMHDKSIAAIGFGKLQIMLLFILGFGLMGDSIELMMIAYILPGAEKDLCMSSPMKGWLGGIAFAGMIFGGMIWGNLADRIGRKSTLITSLSVNAIFTISSAFMPTYALFVICRFFSGLGIGGSIPVVMTYFGEFCPREKRGFHVGLLLMFWVFGGVYVSGLGVIIIPNSVFHIDATPLGQFSSWRTFILICVLPVIMSIIGLLFMPESPRFLLQVGRDLDALAVYKRVSATNGIKNQDIPLPEINQLEQYDSEPFSKDDKKPPTFMESCSKFWDAFFCVFQRPLTMTTMVLGVLWFSVCFGNYGLEIWFPEYMKHLQESVYFSKTENTYNEVFMDQVQTGLLDNIHYHNCTFINISFTDTELRHIIFDSCNINLCQFTNVKAEKTKFLESVIMNTNFSNTNLYEDRFVNCDEYNVLFENPEYSCRVDFEINYNSRRVFIEAFIDQLPAVPGTFINAVLLGMLPRVPQTVAYLALSSLSVFLIWFMNTEVAVVTMNAFFVLAINSTFNCLDVVTIELYPTNLRSTAFGFLTCLGRIASVIANATFGNFIDVSKAIPVLVTTSVLTFGTIVAIKLPESKNKLL